MQRFILLGLFCAPPLTLSQEWQSADHAKKYGNAFIGVKEFGWGASEAFIRRANELATSELDIYQFGVYTGGSMKGIHKRIGVYRRIWGFDSFEGLPKESRGVRLEGKHWLPGGFSSKGALKARTPEEAMQRVYTKLQNPKAMLIKGFFSDSLTALDLSSCRPALIVDIDSDLYISAKQALTWLFKHKIARVGTLIRYDDWNAGDPSWGEPKAHKEISIEFGISFHMIRGNEYEVTAVHNI